MSVPTHSARCGYLLWAFILLFAGTALVASLYPFRLPESFGAAWDSFGFELSTRLGGDPLFSVVQRAVLFVPLGLLLHRCLRLGRLPFPLLRAWALASLLCLGIELLQPLLSERHARLADFALASAMAGLGATLSSLLVLGVGLGLGLLSWLALERIRRSRRGVSGFILAAVPVAGFDLGLALWFGHHPDPGLHLALAIGVVLGLALSWSVASGRSPQPAPSGSARR